MDEGLALSTSSSKKRGPFSRTDWFVAILVTAAVLVEHPVTDAIGTLERRFYDYGSTSGGRQPSERIAVIAIDDQSIGNIGRWPWPRDVHAQLIDQLDVAKAKTVVYTTFLIEPQTDRGLVFIRKIRDALGAQAEGHGVKGKDLVELCKSGNLLSVPKVVAIVARVAEALAYAHRQNVVHRDIKPANIMYESDSDTVKVTDFGIARITDSSKTKTGLVLGTPSFVSPEQIAGNKVDGRSDLYSLGVMLAQMLTGVLPFRGDSMAELMYKIASEEAPDVRVLRPDINERLANVVALSLSKRPESRYQDGERFAADLRSALDEPAAASIRPGGSPGYDAPEAAQARTSDVFARTNVMTKPARPGGPPGDAQTDLEARPGKL